MLLAMTSVCCALNGAIGQEPAVSATPSAVIDIRGIWHGSSLNKKKAAARGIDASVVKIPTKTLNVNPQYPLAAKRAGQMGTVAVDCRIDIDGVPRDCVVTRPVAPLLDAEALACVSQWRYRPLLLRGEPRAALVDFTITFMQR